MPLPFYMVVQWERKLLQAGGSITEHLILGGFLIMIWSGLRLADLQLATHKSLMASYSEIRGFMLAHRNLLKWSTLGITGISFPLQGEFSLSMRFLQQWDYTFSTHSCDDTDFLIPAVPGTDPYCYGTTCLTWRRWDGFDNGSQSHGVNHHCAVTLTHFHIPVMG